MKELVNKLFCRHRNIETTPDMAKVIAALRRLAENDDFQLFRAVLLQSRYADCARSLTSCGNDAVDLLRGQMFSLDRLFYATSKEGIDALAEDAAEQEDLSRQMQQMENDTLIY